MQLTKSDFIVGRDCPTKLFYKKSRYISSTTDDEFMQFLADGGYMVETMARLLHPDGKEMPQSGDADKAFAATRGALASGDVTLFEATVLYENLLVRVDILKQVGDTLYLIEVKSSSIDGVVPGESPFRTSRGGIDSDWRKYLEDVSFQAYVLSKAFPELKVVPHLCVVDKSRTATKNSTYENFQLKRADRFRPEVNYTGDIKALQDEHVLATVDVTAEVTELLPGLEPDIKRFAKSLASDPIKRIPPQIGQHCKGCEYAQGFRECWKDLADADPHILDLYYISSLGGKDDVVAELAARDKSSLLDLPEDRLKGKRGIRQKLQLDHTRSDSEYIAPQLPKLLRAHKHPLQFIDFEASRLALPYHAEMRPYELAAFQWSCHTVDGPGKQLKHAEWLNTDDAFPNFSFARSLMESLDREGTIYIWSKFERTVLREVLRQYDAYNHDDPELREWLAWITRDDAFVDLWELATNYYFHPIMKGSLSIKYVLPAVWAASKTLSEAEEFSEYVKRNPAGELLSPYDALPPVKIGGELINVQEGTGAILAYQEMMFGAGRADKLVKEAYARLLLQYCRLDTAAMVMIWRHWTTN